MYYNNPGEEEEITPEAEEAQKERGKFAAFLYKNTPHKGQTKKQFISSLVMDIAVVALLCAVIFCIVYAVRYKKEVGNDRDIATIMDGVELLDTNNEVELEKMWAELKAAYPDVEFPEGLNVKLAKLYAINQDVVGWLSIDGIDLTTAIVQGEDNAFYLYRDTYKEETKYGTPFVDYRNVMDTKKFSRNTIVYGHNTHDGLKFYNLTQYMTLDGYKKAPVITMESLFQGTTKWKVFAVCLTNSNTNEFEYLYTEFENETAFQKLVGEMRSHSMFDIDVDVKDGDNLLTLYTCFQNYFSGGRLVIFARELREGESETVNIAAASKNTDCIYPQAYYGTPTTAKADEPVNDPIPTEETTTESETTTEPETTTEAPTEAPTDPPTDPQPSEGEIVTDGPEDPQPSGNEDPDDPPGWIGDDGDGDDEYVIG